MKIGTRSSFGLLTLVFVTAGFAAQAQSKVEEEIQGLIHAVALSGCEFERNGKRYAALEAADHLELKYRRGKRHAKTAEMFIDRLASKSSITARAYLIICAASGEHLAKDWLEHELNTQRSKN